MSRLIIALLLGGLALAHVTGAAADTTDRPNFIIFIADDMAWNDCGAYGHPRIRTPNIDRLATDGMRFDRAFLTTSSCSPSRCSIMTGRYPHSTGAGELHLPLPADQVMFTTPLREAGYYTAAAGKWHMGNDAKSQFDMVLEGGGPSGCENWLPALADRPRDKPFFLWLAASDPHRGYQKNTIPQPHEPTDAIVPPFLPDVPATREDLAMYYDEIARMDDFIGKVLAELDAQGEAQNTLILFISDNGRPFPRCKTTVYDSGVRTPFIVRWPATVVAGSVNTNIVSTIDIAPTFCELAGAKVPASFQGTSFAATLKDPAVVTRSTAFAEHNWHDYSARERGVRSLNYLYIRNDYNDLTGSPPADAVRSPTYEAMQRLRKDGRLPSHQSGCFIAPRPAEELYYIPDDPYQLSNVIDDPRHALVLAEARRTLDQWQKHTDDAPPAERRPDEFDRITGERLPGFARPARNRGKR